MKSLKLLVTNPSLFIKKVFGGPLRLYKIHILKDEFIIEMTRWKKNKGDKTHRLDYPTLTEESIVFDLGGYLGDFAHAINKKYGCYVYVFEPHQKFYEECTKRFSINPKVTPLNFGVSDVDGKFFLSDSVDGSSFSNPTHENKQGIECIVKEFFKTLSDLDIAKVNLMKINIEGGEYPLLMHIADNDKLGLVDEYQIQFHNFIEDAEHKRESIIKFLSKTHKRTWCYTFVWENWKKI